MNEKENLRAFYTNQEFEKIPFIPHHNLNYKISVKNMIFDGNAISMGNPHFVIFVSPEDDVMEFAKKYGPIIETSAEFPEKTNVEFVKIKSFKKYLRNSYLS